MSAQGERRATTEPEESPSSAQSKRLRLRKFRVHMPESVSDESTLTFTADDDLTAKELAKMIELHLADDGVDVSHKIIKLFCVVELGENPTRIAGKFPCSLLILS